MSDDLGDFLREAARRRKERRDRQEGAQPRPRPAVEPEQPSARALSQGETEVRQTLSDQSQFGKEQAMGEVEAARYAAREKRQERVGFADRPVVEKRPKAAPHPGLAATPTPVAGAFSQPQPSIQAIEIARETEAQALLRLLRSPGGVRQAFVMAEIFRPKHLDG
jgi:hypothetical protein